MTRQVTQQDIYLEIKDFRKEIIEMMDKAEERCIKRYETLGTEVHDTTNWRNKLIGQITVIVAILGLGINWLYDLLTRKL